MKEQQRSVSNLIERIRGHLLEWTLIILLSLGCFALIYSSADYQQQCNDFWIKNLKVNGFELLQRINENTKYDYMPAPIIAGIQIKENYQDKNWSCRTLGLNGGVYEKMECVENGNKSKD